MRWKSHVRCGAGEKTEIISKSYLSLSDSFKKEDDSILNSDKPVNTQENKNTNGEVFPSENDLPF